MADRERPDTQHEMIYQLWYAIHGSNGDSIWEMQRSTQKELREIDNKLDEFLMSRASTCPTARIMEEREADRRQIIQDSASRYYKRFAAIVSVVSILVTTGALVVAIVSVA